MSLLLIFFLVFGAAALLFILIYAMTSPDIYFSAAFSIERPKAGGPTSASTNEIVCYWVTRIFLFCVIGILLIYLFNLIRNYI